MIPNTNILNFKMGPVASGKSTPEQIRLGSSETHRFPDYDVYVYIYIYMCVCAYAYVYVLLIV